MDQNPELLDVRTGDPAALCIVVLQYENRTFSYLSWVLKTVQLGVTRTKGATGPCDAKETIVT